VCATASFLDTLAPQNEIKARILFVVACAEPSSLEEAYGLARLVGHVYGRTSDVLHRRDALVNVPDNLIGEWETVIDRAEAFATAGLAAFHKKHCC
jgi:hypothetical protein